MHDGGSPTGPAAPTRATQGVTTGAPRTAWRVLVGRDQYGGFADRAEAEVEATRRRALGAARVEVCEVWLNPYEHVVGVAQCVRCGERMPRFDRRVVTSAASIVCGPCSIEQFGYEDEEPTLVEYWPVEQGYVDDAGEYQELPGPAIPEKASAIGGFRTYETTFAAMGDGDLVEVQLISERGDHAHFAMDRRVAARVAQDLERQLAEASSQERLLSKASYHYDRFLGSPPPKLAPLAVPGTDVFFTFGETPHVTVEQATDRIALCIWSEDASLNITMQGGVAAALWRFLARAAGRRR